MTIKTKAVFIFGAGASAEYGAPVMSNFIDMAEDLYLSGRVIAQGDDFKLVLSALRELRACYAGVNIPPDNLESLLSACEIASIAESLGKMPKEDAMRLSAACKNMISTTLLLTCDIKPEKSNSYDTLIQALCEKKKSERNRFDFSIITTNYDVILDTLLRQNRIDVDYCIDENVKPNTWKLLKLHGSLNWQSDSNGSFSVIHTPLLNYKDHSPYIVPPVMSKMPTCQKLSSVWKNAARELSSATHICIIGHSLPPTDSFITYLLAIASLGESRLRRIVVINPDPSVEDKYRQLLGNVWRNRYSFSQNTFSSFLHIPFYGIAREHFNVLDDLFV